ncbi:hypothetical protein PHLGIDRAFT_130459 [Phlebiopsis gigantea 11061_1 CR5-6]|uniref:F-box domain-containing protein n=1 Tax=Phlebiopsis gigantea (strain 11061_1 CR5-6) TaxID=745531 RepID=A0A0C3S4F8_PHLG1|nr:hypothetical protein PHLGIDRAFT_130459 [Phlebiopsis gigantea 11061_1 CR5-6]
MAPGPTCALLLPQELIDYAIDYVALPHADTNQSKESVHTDLTSCSLVARAWVARSSRYLLEHTGIGTVRNKERKRFWKAPEDALQFLQSSPRLQTNIRKLSFRGRIDLPVYLDSFFGLLPRLRSLELNSPPAERYSARAFTAPFPPAHTLDRLSLSGLPIWCLPPVLGLFKKIDTLELSPWCSHHAVELIPGTHIPAIDHLTLKYSHSAGVEAIADSLQQLLRPRSVVCFGLPSHVLDVFCRFLSHAGDDVEELTLAPMLRNYSVKVGMAQYEPSGWGPCFHDTFTVERDPGVMTLWAGCTHLRLLNLHLVDVPDYERICRGAFLSLPPSVHTVAIQLRARQLEVVLDVIATAALANAQAGLQRLEFSKLHLPIPGLSDPLPSLWDALNMAQLMLPNRFVNVVEILP